VTAEYNVFLTPAMEEQIFLLQYPNRPRTRPYNNTFGATPQNMRIKPEAGYLEVDVKLNTDHNFNKFMGLKWGDATQSSKELHNATGTYGLAAGLAAAKSRALMSNRAKPLADRGDRDIALEDELVNFQGAEAEGRVFSTQTLGGQIVRHDGQEEAGKANYFAGTFDGGTLHLTKITGTVQMRPQFHHLDAEEERNRIAATRAQAEAAEAGPAPTGHALRQRIISDEEKKSAEHRLKQILRSAEQEQWIQMQYIDEETDRAYTAFEDKLFVKDTADAPTLKSTMDNMEYLDAISAPRHDSPTRRRRRPPRRKRTVDPAAGDDEDHDEFHDDEDDEDENPENGTGTTAPDDGDTQMVE
jgi:DNA-directed RNA polymerase-3 subunit RPC5